MPTYTVTVPETWVRIIQVNANSIEEAKAKGIKIAEDACTDDFHNLHFEDTVKSLVTVQENT